MYIHHKDHQNTMLPKFLNTNITNRVAWAFVYRNDDFLSHIVQEKLLHGSIYSTFAYMRFVRPKFVNTKEWKKAFTNQKTPRTHKRNRLRGAFHHSKRLFPSFICLQISFPKKSAPTHLRLLPGFLPPRPRPLGGVASLVLRPQLLEAVGAGGGVFGLRLQGCKGWDLIIFSYN